MVDIAQISHVLKKKGIEIYPKTLKKSKHQGVINLLYIVDSSIGKLKIKVGSVSERRVQLQKNRRIHYVSNLLSKKGIPTTKSLVYGVDSQDNPYIVLEYAEGKRLADVKNKKEKAKYVRQLCRILYKMHNIKLPGGGLVTPQKGKVRGKCKTWETYLKKEVYSQFKEIYEAKKLNKKDYLRYKKHLVAFFRKNKKMFKKGGRLLHGDANYDNVIVDGKKIVALIDFEWADVGDPAYEFTLSSEYIDEYMKENKVKDKDGFAERAQAYQLIKHIFIANSFRFTNKDWAMKFFKIRMKKWIETGSLRK